MRYIDINDIVVSTTHSLDQVPADIIQDLLGSEWYLPAITTTGPFLVGIEDPRIECITHAQTVGTLPSAWLVHPPVMSEGGSYYHVCSIVVEGVTAFSFIYLSTYSNDCPWERTLTHTYILDVTATKKFIKIIISIYLDRLDPEEGVDVERVSKLDELPELTVCAGVEIQYGPAH